MRIEGSSHTVRGPREAARLSTRVHAVDLARLEPHVAGRVPRVDVLALGHPRHVELDRARVRDALIGRATKRATGCYRRGSGVVSLLVVLVVGVVVVGDAMVNLVV